MNALHATIPRQHFLWDLMKLAMILCEKYLLGILQSHFNGKAFTCLTKMSNLMPVSDIFRLVDIKISILHSKSRQINIYGWYNQFINFAYDLVIYFKKYFSVFLTMYIHKDATFVRNYDSHGYKTFIMYFLCCLVTINLLSFFFWWKYFFF